MKTEQIKELVQRYDAIFQSVGLTHHPVSGRRLDANDTAFLVRQVEYLRARTLEVRYPALLARSFVPTATDVPNWVNYAIQVVEDHQGQAKVIANGANDLPQTNVTVSEKSFPVVSIGTSYSFTLHDLRQSIALGQPLPDKKSKAARRVDAVAADEILATGGLASAGQGTLGMVGLLTSSAVPAVTPTTDFWDDTDTTPDQILADLNKLAAAPRIATNQIFSTTNILLSQSKYERIATRPRSTNSDTTVLDMFLRTNPGVSVDVWYRCDLAGDGGTDDLAVAYSKNPEVLEGIVPQEFEQLPPQFQGFSTTVYCHSRCGGVRIWQPKAMAYMSLANCDAE
jgi:hypothetical protein